MPRFRNTVNGVVVSVDEEAGMPLAGSWEPVEEESTKASKSKRASQKKTAEGKAKSTSGGN